MITAIKKNLVNFVAIIGLIVIAGGVAAYILSNQRMRFPFIEEKPFQVNAEFSTAQAVTPGQGQTVRVSGVRIGDIGGVKLKNGKAIVRMDIDRKYEGMIRRDATAFLRPKTGLKDMFIELDPGSSDAAKVGEGFTIPIAATTPDVNPDEIFSVLDDDTRAYLRLLVNGAGRGLEGRGGDLQDLFRRFEPTHRDLARVNSAVATRRHNLRNLVTSLNTLSGELATKDDDIAALVDSSSAVLRSFASESSNLTAAVHELPSALSQTTDTLQRVGRFADVLKPAAKRLRPAARALAPANRALRPFAREATPLLQDDIRPFVREARPLARDLRPASDRLAGATPALTEVFKRLNRFLNMAAYNPNGREDKGNADRQEGYLFWAAWLQHMGAQLFSSSDAHGTFRPVTLGAPCQTVKQIVHEVPELEFLAGLTPLITESPACATD